MTSSLLDTATPVDAVATGSPLPRDLPELTPFQARLLIERTQDLLPLCKHVGIVVEAGGARGAEHRRLTTRVKLASSRDYSLSVVSTIESALRWAPGPLAEEAELRMAFASIGHELPDLLPTCVPRTAKVA